MESFNSTDGWYEGRPVASGSTPQNRSPARSSPPTKTSIARTGLSSQIQSSRHSGNNVLCPRSTPSTKRLIGPTLTGCLAFLFPALRWRQSGTGRMASRLCCSPVQRFPLDNGYEDLKREENDHEDG